MEIKRDDKIDKSLQKFSDNEILNITRPDSIINKDFDESFKMKGNYFMQAKKNDLKEISVNVTGLGSSEKDKLIIQLNDRNKQLEARLQETEVLKAKQKQELEVLKLQLSGKSGGGDGNLEKKLKLKEDQYNTLKKENDFQWGKLMDVEKKLRET